MAPEKEKTMTGLILSLVSLLAVIAFLLIGFTTGVWHPTWVVFLATPLARIILGMVDLKKGGNTSPDTQDKQ